LIHGAWFYIGKSEKSCLSELWRLILRKEVRKGEEDSYDGYSIGVVNEWVCGST
jgi:hypothetical protein